MSKPFKDWTVLPHGRMRHHDDNLVTVAGVLRMPIGDVVRRMTIVRLGDGRLVVYSAIALDESEMHELESFGEVAYLVVPNGLHRMDIRAWKDRFPAAMVVTPAGAREKVEELVPVDMTSVDFRDPSVSYVTVPGTAEREAALVVITRSGTTLVLNDLIFTLANRKGVSGWFWKTLGMTGEDPHLPPLVKMRLVEDEAAVKDQLERWSRIPSLNRIIVSHGAIIEADPKRVLGSVAQGLAS